jgi:flagellar basal-body rod modification protein FlgD
MITPASSALSATGAPASTGATSGRSELDKNAFLQLLVTQLRNQDPLSPLQPHEFAAQLAQFSSVEQLSQLNQSVAQQIQDGQLQMLLSKTSFSASLMGRRVVAVGDQVDVPESGRAKVRIEVGGTGGHGVLVLKDSNGKEVSRRDLGNLPPGRQTLELPAGLPAGSWHYSVQVTGAKDAQVPVTTYTSGVVDAVFFRDGGIVLKVGSIELSLDDLAEIESAPATATTPGDPPAPAPPDSPPQARGGSVRTPILRKDVPV